MENRTDSCRPAQNEDERALIASLVDRYFDPLVLFLNRYLHNVAEAEDAAQDALLSLLLRPRALKPETAKAYLFRTGRNRALNLLRSRRDRPLARMEDESEEYADLCSLEEDVLKKEEAKALWRALSSLPREQQEAMHLVYIEEMSYRDAGRVMGKSVKQIDNLISRAKTALRGKLEKEGS